MDPRDMFAGLSDENMQQYWLVLGIVSAFFSLLFTFLYPLKTFIFLFFLIMILSFSQYEFIKRGK